MKLKIDVAYVCIVLFCILLSLSVYKTVEAGVIDWLLGGTRTVEVVLEAKVPKTIDSEIDRLSVKYNVASSTVRAVAKCESQLYDGAINFNYHNVVVGYTKDGQPIVERLAWSVDKFDLQINDYYHKQPMAKLGLDYENRWDSLEYGIKMMSEQGLQPWSASKKCWSKLI